MEQYVSINLTFEEMRDRTRSEDADPLKSSGEARRVELKCDARALSRCRDLALLIARHRDCSARDESVQRSSVRPALSHPIAADCGERYAFRVAAELASIQCGDSTTS